MLVSAVAGLWSVLTAVVSGALRWLLMERARLIEMYEKQIATLKAEYAAELARKEAKLEEAADLAQRQAASQQNQIELQQRMIETLQSTLGQRHTP